jgi:hypothetical protein
MEEKALEGRIPTRVRFGNRALAPACPLRRFRQACSSFDSSFPFPEVIRAVPLRRVPRGIADTEKPLKPRRSRVRAEPGKGRRGEAPRGVPRAGRSKTLKGEPHGCWAVDGPSSGAQGASRREGIQTLRAEGAGRWNSRVNRICCAGMCRRGVNSRSADCVYGPSADADGAMGTPAT